ncbi:MAG: DUF4276 family protein [Deltaproteobacteria bacterium]|nr:DUF4276 family protein [Deltaproteobacteria bacterium]
MVKHPRRKLFVEGGGNDNASLKTECRKAFKIFLEVAGFSGRLPAVIPCGGRRRAFDQFCTAIERLGDGDVAILLVDSEGPITGNSPWDHVKKRRGDEWERPTGSSDDQLHLMVQCMESWFLADRKTLREFFNQGFRENALPSATADIEDVSKEEVFRKLSAATRDTKTKGEYDKGKHAFKLLERVDPGLIREASSWAKRFLETLDSLL